MKRCYRCDTLKPLAEFPAHPRMADGRLNLCKVCSRERAREFRKRRLDHWRTYDRNRAQARTAAGDWTRKSKAQRARDPVACRARQAVSNAIRDGRLRRPTSCAECAEVGRVQAHHDDYAKPLDVRWLCRRCHIATHSMET